MTPAMNGKRSVGVQDVTTGQGTFSFVASDVGVGPVENLPEPPAGQSAVGSGVEVISFNQNQEYTVIFHYDEDELTETGLDEHSLNVYQYNESSEWSPVCEDFSLDVDANTATASIEQFEGIVVPLASEESEDSPCQT